MDNEQTSSRAEQLAAAIQCHQAGQLDQAAKLYMKLAGLYPDDEEPLYLLGILSLDLGSPQSAQRFLREALALSPDFTDARLQLALACAANGQIEEAEQHLALLPLKDSKRAEVHHAIGQSHAERGQSDLAEMAFTQALAISSERVETWLALAELLLNEGRYTAAESACAVACTHDEDSVEAFNLLGMVLTRQERYAEAATAFRRVLEKAPDQPQVLANLGYALIQLGYYTEAENCLSSVLEAHPDMPAALLNMGILHLKRGDAFAAEHTLRRAIEANPALYQATNNLGLALQKQGRMREALEYFRQALEMRPDYVEALSNLGNACRLVGERQEAERHLRRALEIAPDAAGLWNNLGAVCLDGGDFEQARNCFAKALEAHPDLAPARWNLALAQLALGDFENGWANFESRWEGCHTLGNAYRKPVERAWQGEPLAGKTLLLWAEQGLGDTFQFIRYASELAAMGARVVAEVQPPLVGLISTAPGMDEVFATGLAPDDYDFHCPLMSLPHRLGTRLETIPSRVPYLFADEEKIARWRERLAADSAYKIGLVWAGGSRPGFPDLEAIDARRSLRLALFAPLSEVPGVRLYSLQKGGAAKEATAPDLGFEVIDHTDELDDFSDTAALLQNLDLIISVDTSVAHLAGAMARPVWLLNRRDTCWRWLLERTDTPWYPTMRLFRQGAGGGWQQVVEDIAAALIVHG